MRSVFACVGSLMVAGAVGSALESGAAPLAAGYRESVDVSVPAAQVSNLTERLWVSEGMLNKRGEGALAVAASNLTLQTDGRLAVRGGTLAVSGLGGTDVAEAPCPMDVMAGAAFWVDAGQHVTTVTSNDNAYADLWLDVRETGTAGSYLYPRAVAEMAATQATNCAPQLVSEAGPNGPVPAIWFGGFGSRRSMTWTRPNGSVADITSIRHVFAVHGVFNFFGYVFGSHGGNPDFHIQGMQDGSPDVVIWRESEITTTPLRQGRTYLDGLRVDGTVTLPKRGWQLLEVALDMKTVHASNFFNDRFIDFSGVRMGGDYLCEAVVFTNKLTEIDRLRVQAYLMRKWLAPQPQQLAADISATGAFDVDVAAGATVPGRVNGDGALVKRGPGTAVLEAGAFIKGVPRSAEIHGGVLDTRLPVPLTLAAGDRVTAAGTALSRTQDAGAGRLVKDGDGAVTLTEFPQGVAALDIAAGTLILSLPSDAVTIAVETRGSLPNANFEDVPLTANRRRLARGETYLGWTADWPVPSSGPENDVFIFNRGAGTSEIWPCNFDAPEGAQVLALKRDASVSTTLTLPVAGVYDISFFTSGRNGYGDNEFTLCIVNGTETNRVATVSTTPAAYVKQVFRLPWLEAGGHTLLLKSVERGVDSVGTFDDFNVRLVTETRPGHLPVPNGDFELNEYPRSAQVFGSTNVAVGWTFSPPVDGWAIAGLTCADSSASFYAPSTAYGSAMLGLVSNGAAWATLTLPAGTYKLRGDTCNWVCYLNGKNLSGTQSIVATITRGSGDSEVLGEARTTASMMTPFVWPTAFTVAENETVTLTLAGGANQMRGGLVDNLVLLPQDAGIVKNGGFEVDADWTFVFDKSVLPYDDSRYQNIDPHYGTDVYDGNRWLRLTQTGLAWQDIQFAEPGLYRLVFHAVRRVESLISDTYGRNPVRAWLAQGGVTNVIGWTRVDDDALVRREFLFRVAAAGTYRLGLQGMTDNSAAFPGNDQTTLLDGVWIEPVAGLAGTDFPLPRNLAVTIADGAKLQLAFDGTQVIGAVRHNGRYLSGLIDQATYPQLVSGPGALYVFRKGTVLLIQ